MDNTLPIQTTPDAIDWSAALASHRSWIRKVVNARLHHHQHDVDDVVQEISSAVLKQNARPEDPAKVAPWLYGVAVRQASQFLRRQGRQERLLDRYNQKAPPPATPLPNPRDWVMQRERHRSVRDSMEKLPPEEREILILKYTEDLTYRQLADLLGVTEKVVEHRLLKARQALRLQLQHHDD